MAAENTFEVLARESFCLFNAAKPGAHCGHRLIESIELLGDEYRCFFCEYSSTDAPHSFADARYFDSSRSHDKKSSLTVLLRLRIHARGEGRLFLDSGISVPSSSKDACLLRVLFLSLLAAMVANFLELCCCYSYFAGDFVRPVIGS